ncbi:hypothetical protein EVAR_47414_1 [Eumeta japonica]|uniref:Uncharacterized protein n=1 Tax=Eumeta variegata TaxID=151549 RepID=A0A4C1Y3L3_EUMVA|nr:hypothetical protein EVAR_47414_1 [Eumeta japonica]
MSTDHANDHVLDSESTLDLILIKLSKESIPSYEKHAQQGRGISGESSAPLTRYAARALQSRSAPRALRSRRQPPLPPAPTHSDLCIALISCAIHSSHAVCILPYCAVCSILSNCGYKADCSIRSVTMLNMIVLTVSLLQLSNESGRGAELLLWSLERGRILDTPPAAPSTAVQCCRADLQCVLANSGGNIDCDIFII